MKQSVLKKSIKNINFTLITEDICDPIIIYDKFIKLYDNAKQYLIATSHIFNILELNKDTKEAREEFRNHIEESKKELYKYKNYRMFLVDGFNNGITKDLENELSATFKLFCKSPIINIMMYSFRILSPYNDTDKNWVINSKIPFCPFKNCVIDSVFIYKNNKTVAVESLNKLKQCTQKFYDNYILPNFNLDKAIDGMCDLIQDLHKKNQVKCNLIPPYIRTIQKANIIDIQQLNLLYLELNNQNTFVLGVMDSLLNVKGDVVQPNFQTQIQLNNLINYIESNNTNSKLTSTIKVGKDILSGNM